jgi:DNA mismatch repair protein MutS2
VPVYSKILADIGDEQSIEQSLSTFSAHISNIIRILEKSDEGTLVLMDELGAGTDPVEGAALAIAIIEEARRRGARIAATTHYAELKVFAMTTPGVVNAACEFDVETLRPTYKLLIGVPGKSNAFAIARRLGLSEEVIARAKEQVDSGSLRFEDVLTQLESKRQEMERERIEAARLRREAEERNKAAEEYKARMERERAKASERAKAEARQIVEQTRATSDEIFAQLQEMRKQKSKEESWQAVNEARTEIRRRLNEAEQAFSVREEETETLPPTRPAKLGDTVLLLGIGTKAAVLSEQKDGTLELQAGILKITARQSEVRVLEGESGKERGKNRAEKESKPQFRSAAPARELDLRGMTVDEAIAALGQFLDGAMLTKVETVTIIHGKGTGALRNAVHQELKNSRYVRRFRLGRYGEGESGVTIAEMK